MPKTGISAIFGQNSRFWAKPLFWGFSPKYGGIRPFWPKTPAAALLGLPPGGCPCPTPSPQPGPREVDFGQNRPNWAPNRVFAAFLSKSTSLAHPKSPKTGPKTGRKSVTNSGNPVFGVFERFSTQNRSETLEKWQSCRSPPATGQNPGGRRGGLKQIAPPRKMDK